MEGLAPVLAVPENEAHSELSTTKLLLSLPWWYLWSHSDFRKTKILGKLSYLMLLLTLDPVFVCNTPISFIFFPPIGPLGIHLTGTAAGDPRGMSPSDISHPWVDSYLASSWYWGSDFFQQTADTWAWSTVIQSGQRKHLSPYWESG